MCDVSMASVGASASRRERMRERRERMTQVRRDEEDRGLLTLNTILRSLGRVALTIELRNDTLLTGQLEESDAYMNISLSDARGRHANGDLTEEQAIHIKGTSIRCIHLPNDVNCEGLMRSRIKAADQGARAFSQRKAKPASGRPTSLEPIVGTVVGEADADLG